MDGKAHFNAWKNGILPTAAAAGILGLGTGDPLLFVGVTTGYAMGAYVSPDLDLVGITTDESRMMKHWGLLGVIAVMWWFPYAYLMRFIGIGRRGHRNFFSHFPGVSTLIRLLWMSLPVAGILWYAGAPMPAVAWSGVVGVLLGLSIADTIHYILDIL